MVFLCSTCNRTFEKRNHLKKHLNSGIPCGLMCKRCGETMNNAKSYERHINMDNCQPIDYTDDEVQKKLQQQYRSRDVKTNNTYNNVYGDINVNNTLNIQNINIQNLKSEQINTKSIRLFGLYAHEDEAWNYPEVYSSNMNDLFEIIVKNFGTSSVPDTVMNRLLSSFAQLFHSNVDTPEYVNIMDDNKESNHNKIYSGCKFIDDVMTKNIRNKRVIQRILGKVKEFIKSSDVIPEIVEFCEQQFIPYLVNIYVKCESHDNLQQTWQMNKQIVDKMDFGKIPASRGRHLSRTDFIEQCQSMISEDQSIHAQYLVQNSRSIINTFANSLNYDVFEQASN